MKPVSTQTISRLVWITLVTSNGRMFSSGSGPRYLVADSRPNTICRPNNNMATAKYQYATSWERYLIGDLRAASASLQCREIGDQLIDLLRRQFGIVGRHEALALGRVHRAWHDVCTGRDERLANVAVDVACLALVVRSGDPLRGGGRNAAERRTGHV